jgi:3-oxoacyl-[acyl-carrier-protein] synthase III
MTSMRSVYLTGCSAFLPNDPISNDRIDAVLGELPSRYTALERRVLASNGIQSRHYAIDPDTRALTHSNASLTVEAIRRLCADTDFSIERLQCLACGTSSADQVIPGHASMVHAELAAPVCETISPAGVCCSGVSALKYGFLNVAAGLSDNAIATGSELASPTLRASHFRAQLRLLADQPEDHPLLPFSNVFLRWMLSDGAGAVLVQPRPAEHGPSLRVDWIDLLSYASESDVCMHFGLQKQGDGSIEGYRTIDDEKTLWRGGFLSLAQDVQVLNARLPPLMRKALAHTIRARELQADAIDWLLPHYSSQFFRKPLESACVELGLAVPTERWFSNLQTKGNTGSASIYVMLDELVSSGKLRAGQRILCMVPESSRMLFAFMHFTVV